MIDFNKISTMKSNDSSKIPNKNDLNLDQSEIDKISNLRNNVIYNTTTKHKPGDIVYNCRDKEYGFIVGLYPDRSSKERGNVYFVVTYRNDAAEAGIRYVQEKFIVSIRSTSEEIPKGIMTDFCNNYCIMDCDTCPLKAKLKK